VGKEMVRRVKKGIEEVVQYTLSHTTRIQVLAVLNEGSYTAAEISRKIGLPPKTVQNHLRRMVAEGSIEIDKEVSRGNRAQYTYRSVVFNTYSAEEFERLPFRFRQHIAGAILNSGIAEILAGFHAGKLAEPRAHEYWDWYNVDEKARDDADVLTHRFLRDIRKLEDESITRAAKSGEETTSMLLELFFFERPRKGADRPHRFVADRASRTTPPSVSSRLHAARRYFGWGDHYPPSI
jgi:DNA-binding transcriptional ArsR family regulator